MPGPKPFYELIRKINGKAGAEVLLEAGDVGAYTKAETDAAVATGAATSTTNGTAVGGETTLLLPVAVPALAAGRVTVNLNGQLLEAAFGDFTTNGTTTLTLATPLFAGAKWLARVRPH